MKQKLTIFSFIIFTLCSCKLLGIGGSKSKEPKQDGGCPTNGRNIGAEKLLSGDAKSEAAAKKAAKYNKGKQLIY